MKMMMDDESKKKSWTRQMRREHEMPGGDWRTSLRGGSRRQLPRNAVKLVFSVFRGSPRYLWGGRRVGGYQNIPRYTSWVM
jgi:hypothetical protein